MISSAVVTYLGMGLALISAPLLARSLGADGRGVLAGAFVSIQLLSWVAFLGLPRGLAIQSLRESSTSRRGLTVVSVLGPLSAVLAFLSADVVSNGDARIALGVRIGAVVLLGAGVCQIGIESTLIRGQLWRFNSVRAVTLIVPPAAYIVAFLVGGLTLTTAFLITLLSQVVATVLGCVFAAQVFTSSAKIRTPWRFSLRYWASSAFDSVGGRVDQLVLTAFTSAPTLGTYAVAVTCSAASAGLTQALNQLTYSRFAATTADEASSALRSRARYGFVLSVVCGVAVLSAVALLGGVLFGPTYHDLLPITAVLIVVQLFNDQWTLRVYFHSANGNADYLATSSAISLGVLGGILAGLELTHNLDGLTMSCAVLAFSICRLLIRRVISTRRRPGGDDIDPTVSASAATTTLPGPE